LSREKRADHGFGSHGRVSGKGKKLFPYVWGGVTTSQTGGEKCPPSDTAKKKHQGRRLPKGGRGNFKKSEERGQNKWGRESPLKICPERRKKVLVSTGEIVFTHVHRKVRDGRKKSKVTEEDLFL